MGEQHRQRPFPRPKALIKRALFSPAGAARVAVLTILTVFAGRTVALARAFAARFSPQYKKRERNGSHKGKTTTMIAFFM